MDGAGPLTFRILGKTYVITLPPTIDGVPPANDAARDARHYRGDATPPNSRFATTSKSPHS